MYQFIKPFLDNKMSIFEEYELAAFEESLQPEMHFNGNIFSVFIQNVKIVLHGQKL